MGKLLAWVVGLAALLAAQPIIRAAKVEAE